jgi:hypothetical protein
MFFFFANRSLYTWLFSCMREWKNCKLHCLLFFSEFSFLFFLSLPTNWKWLHQREKGLFFPLCDVHDFFPLSISFRILAMYQACHMTLIYQLKICSINLLLKYYLPIIANGKTFVLVFCVLWITVLSLSTRHKVLPSATVGE